MRRCFASVACPNPIETMQQYCFPKKEECSPDICHEHTLTNPNPIACWVECCGAAGSLELSNQSWDDDELCYEDFNHEHSLTDTMHETLRVAWAFDYTVVLLRLLNPQIPRKRCNETAISKEICDPDSRHEHASTNPFPKNPGFDFCGSVLFDTTHETSSTCSGLKV